MTQSYSLTGGISLNISKIMFPIVEYFFVIQPYSLIGGILSNIAKILFLIVVFSCPGSSIPDLGQ